MLIHKHGRCLFAQTRLCVHFVETKKKEDLTERERERNNAAHTFISNCPFLFAT